MTKLAEIDTWEKQKKLRKELDKASQVFPASDYIPRAMEHLMKVWIGMGYAEDEIKKALKDWLG